MFWCWLSLFRILFANHTNLFFLTFLLTSSLDGCFVWLEPASSIAWNSSFFGGFVYSHSFISMLYSEAIVSQMETHRATVSFIIRSHTNTTIQLLGTDNKLIYRSNDKPTVITLVRHRESSLLRNRLQVVVNNVPLSRGQMSQTLPHICNSSKGVSTLIY